MAPPERATDSPVALVSTPGWHSAPFSERRIPLPSTPAPVTVIVPCYNEEQGLPSLINRLARMRAGQASDWDFLFVDDGSSDGTFAELLRVKRDASWVKIVRHHENLGLGVALRTGFANTRSPVVCTVDSDCTYPPEKLPELVALVRKGADVVTASAWHPESSTAEGSKLRLQLSRSVSGLYKFLIGQDVYTFTCLFRAYSAPALNRLCFRSSGFAAVAEIMLRATLAGCTVREVPMRLESRRFGESKLKVGDAIMAHIGLLLMTAVLVGARQLRGRMMGSHANVATISTALQQARRSRQRSGA